VDQVQAKSPLKVTDHVHAGHAGQVEVTQIGFVGPGAIFLLCAITANKKMC